MYRNMKTLAIAIAVVFTLFTGMFASVEAASQRIETQAKLGERFELRAADYHGSEPYRTHWSMTSSPSGATDIAAQSAANTYIDIVPSIEPGSAFENYEIILECYDQDRTNTTYTIYLELVDEEKITVEEEPTPEKNGKGGVRQFRYNRNVKKETTRLVVRMRFDEVLPKLEGDVEVTVTIRDENGNVVVVGDDFSPKLSEKYNKKRVLKRSIFQTEKTKWNDWQRAGISVPAE